MKETVIDLMPTWRALVPILVEKTSIGPIGRQELSRLAGFADDFNEVMPECVRQLEAAIQCIDEGAEYAARGYISAVLQSIKGIKKGQS